MPKRDTGMLARPLISTLIGEDDPPNHGALEATRRSKPLYVSQ